jgi:hypothetical protein
MKTEKKTGAARTQLAVTDEWWSDERVQSFLAMAATSGENADFHVLIKAYRGMVPEAFTRFVTYFVDAGRNLNDTGPYGKTALAVISEHRHGDEYAQILREAGAQ